MTYFTLLILGLSSLLHARSVELPRGGQIEIDQKEWTVLENKVTPELKSLIIFNKSDEKLKGFILDGTIKNAGVCKKDSGKEWLVCEKKQKVKDEIHHQVYLQRKLGKDAIQNYVMSFNYDLKAEKDFNKKISALKTSLEKK